MSFAEPVFWFTFAAIFLALAAENRLWLLAFMNVFFSGLMSIDKHWGLPEWVMAIAFALYLVSIFFSLVVAWSWSVDKWRNWRKQ